MREINYREMIDKMLDSADISTLRNIHYMLIGFLFG